MSQLEKFVGTYNSFLKQKHIKEMLFILNENKLSGWEKWIQFELFKYLSIQENEVYPECSYCIDGRCNTEKDINRLDIVYRNKSHRTDLYNGIELKVHYCSEYAIGGIITDMFAVNTIAPSEWEFRSILGVACYSVENMDGKSDATKYKAIINSLIKDGAAKIIENIAGWYFLVLYWEADNLSDTYEMKNSYKEFTSNHLL